MIIFNLLSVLLLYKISKDYIKDYRNRLWLVIIFILLPGVISSAIVVNSAGMIIFGLLLFVYIYKDINPKYTYPLLLIYAFVDSNFIYLFFSLMVYSFVKKEKNYFIFNLFLAIISIYLYGLDIYGAPIGYFLDSLGVYAAIFTPIIFIYLIYVLYRKLLTKEIDIIWYISSLAFFISLLLSFRQRVNLEYFAPYLILALPLAAQTFINSYKVRLKKFRKRYKLIFILSLLFLIINALLVLFNKELYIFLDNPKDNFAYKMHVAKELAQDLHTKGIDCIDSSDKMSKRLYFYGIDACKMYKLNELDVHSKKVANVTIRYAGRIVYKANVTKINTL